MATSIPCMHISSFVVISRFTLAQCILINTFIFIHATWQDIVGVFPKRVNMYLCTLPITTCTFLCIILFWGDFLSFYIIDSKLFSVHDLLRDAIMHPASPWYQDVARVVASPQMRSFQPWCHFCLHFCLFSFCYPLSSVSELDLQCHGCTLHEKNL